MPVKSTATATTLFNKDDTQVLNVLKAKHVGDSLNTIDLEEVSTTSSYNSDNSSDNLLYRTINKPVVRFDQASIKIHEVVPARCDLSKEQVRATWYARAELAKMLKQMVTDAINLTKPNGQKPDETNETALGLELYALSKIGKARQQRLRKTRQCVLQEQARLKRNNKKKGTKVSAGVLLYQQQQLRRVSRRCSRKCRDAAVARGKQDEAAISETLQRFRIGHVSSCLMQLSSSSLPSSSSCGAQQQHPSLQDPQLVPALQFFKRLLLD